MAFICSCQQHALSSSSTVWGSIGVGVIEWDLTTPPQTVAYLLPLAIRGFFIPGRSLHRRCLCRHGIVLFPGLGELVEKRLFEFCEMRGVIEPFEI